jgi:hypothetical protein
LSLFADTTYPSEITLTAEEEAIVSDIRKLVGDTPQVGYDQYGFVSPDNGPFSSRVFRGGTLYKFPERSWPLKVTVSGVDYDDLSDPTVNNYEWLMFSTSALLESTFEMFYETFKFSDKEIMEAYDQALIILSERSIPVSAIPQNLQEVQAAIILLEGQIASAPGSIQVTDGRTQFNKSKIADVEYLTGLRNQLKEMMTNVRMHIALNIIGVRLE